MIGLDTDIQTPLKDLFLAKGFLGEVFVNNETPTSELPAVFMEIAQNGPIRSMSTKHGAMRGVLAVSVHVKHLTTGSANNVKMSMVLKAISEMFSSAQKTGDFTYDLDPTAVVYQGKNLAAGYSSKVFNIQVFITH